MCDVPAEDLLGRTRRALAEARRVLRGAEELPPVPEIEDLPAAVDALCAVERVVRARCARPADRPGAPRDGLDSALLQIQSVRTTIAEAQLRRRTGSLSEVYRSLQRLRTSLSLESLMEQVPAELGRLGYSRSLLSRLRGTSWSARSAFAHGDAPLATELVRVGSAMPGRIGREEPETEAVRRRIPILVRDAQSRPRTHRELIMLSDVRDYAAAPIIAQGAVVGLLHVDRHSQLDLVDSFDRDLLGVFAEGVGLALERARYRKRVAALKTRFERQAEEAEELLYGGVEWEAEQAAAHEPVEAAPAYLADGPLAELTRRELEVLRHIAGGATNHDIASCLGVSTGTVKTHMKNIFRKLGAANRSDAAAKFHRLARRHPDL